MGLEVVAPPPDEVLSLEKLAEHGDVRVDWPIVRLASYPDGASVEAVRALFDVTSELFALRVRFALVFDFSALREMPSAQVRRMAAEFQKERAHDFARWVIADASIVPHPVARGLMTAMGWLTDSSHPERVFPTRDQAMAWVQARLAAEG